MKQSQSKLPKFGDWLLRLLARYDVNPHLRGDFDEEFSLVYETKGFVRAWFWYWTHLLRSLPVFIKDIFCWRAIMIMNYLKITLRNIKRHKTFSLINITGLVIGITCFILIMLYVEYEVSYDTFHDHSDRIFRVAYQNLGEMYMGKDAGVRSVAALAPTLMEEYPEVQFATRFKPIEALLHESKNGYISF